MPFSTITTPEARPVANYKMATRMEGGRLLYISGQVAWDASAATSLAKEMSQPRHGRYTRIFGRSCRPPAAI